MIDNNEFRMFKIWNIRVMFLFFRDVTLGTRVADSGRFEGTYLLHLQKSRRFNSWTLEHRRGRLYMSSYRLA